MEERLRPLFEERNRLHALWMNTGSDRDERKFVKARTKARQAVREAKNAWFLMNTFGGREKKE